MKAYLHGPMDAVKNWKLRFRVGDLDLPEEERDVRVPEWRRKKINRIAHVEKQYKSELTEWQTVNYTRRNGTC